MMWAGFMSQVRDSFLEYHSYYHHYHYYHYYNYNNNYYYCC